MQNNNSPLSEIGMLVLASLLVIAGAVLLYLGKINWDAAVFFFAGAGSIFGFNLFYKAPSPLQQGQVNAMQQQIGSVQELALNLANQLAAHVNEVPVQEPPPSPPVQQLVAQVPMAPALNLPDRQFSAVLPAVPKQ